MCSRSMINDGVSNVKTSVYMMQYYAMSFKEQLRPSTGQDK